MRYGNGYQEEQKKQAGILNPGGYVRQNPAGPALGGNVGGTVQKPGFQRQPDYQLMNENTQTEAPAQQPVQEAPPAAQTPQTPAFDVNQQLDALYAQIMNRPGFQFDLNGDALYQQLVDSYTNQGRMAMMDTMGQAATLTGGYGNSYAQGVGQQAYQDYIQGITDQIPDLYSMALNRYIMEGDAMYDQLAALQWQAEFDEDKRRYDQAWEQEYGGGSGGDGGNTGTNPGVNPGTNPGSDTGDDLANGQLSQAGQDFLKSVPYLHAGGDVEGWKRTVAGMLERALENGALTDEDAYLIAMQLGLEDTDPDKLSSQPKEEPLWENPKEWYDTGSGSGGGHRYEMKPWG